jgi:hypothetical protein
MTLFSCSSTTCGWSYEGQPFADEQVAIERARTGSLANYDKLWTEALALRRPSEHSGSNSSCKSIESNATARPIQICQWKTSRAGCR